MSVLWDLLRSLLIVLLLQVAIILLVKIYMTNDKYFNSFIRKKGTLSALSHPPSFPIVGNLLQLITRPLDKLNQWSKEYGPIYSVCLGQKFFIVLNNHEVVNDLIVKRGSNYSSRYDFNNSNSILVKSNLIALTPYGDKWKRDRTVAYSALTSISIKSYYNYISNDSERLLKDLMTKHGQSIYPLQIIKKFVLSNMLNILFGDQSGYDEPLLDDVMKLMDEIAEFSSPLNILTDLIPALNYVYKPNSNKARTVYDRMEEIFSSKYDQFLRDYAHDKELPPSFLLQIQETLQENNSLGYEDIWELLANLLNGAMETEVNTLMWMIACLANNPGVQEEAFKELDELFGRNKPMPKDEMDLPYISAIINETLRYRPPSAFGFPHVAKEDDEYNGYNIPKGTPILLNLFAINHNERRFIAPDKFRPSRFMREYSTGSVKSRSILLPQLDIESEYKKRSSLYGILKNNSPSLNNDSVPMHMSFGAGRRYCIGQHLAQKQLFLAIAYILWAFEIKPGADENGETPLEINLNGGNLTLTSFSPHPYNVKFILRKDISILFQ